MNAMEQDSLLPEGRFDQKFPLPSRERVRVRGLCEPLAPLPHSSPVRDCVAIDRFSVIERRGHPHGTMMRVTRAANR